VGSCCVTLTKALGRSSDAISAITMPKAIATIHVALYRLNPRSRRGSPC
jgi:hypothetical protein